ncbi:hypothetical protein KKI23_00635, partial [Patescibacteria group bacterium]|nr:hypothetical protein [Patescibacteria group bacterium]
MTNKGIFQSVAIMMGAILGVGIFGLPFLGYHAGILPLLGFFVLAIVILYGVSFAYGQVILGTNARHRFPGYVETYLGHNWKLLAFVTTSVGIWGALLSYLIIGGSFLGQIFIPLAGGSEIFYTILFFV